MLHCQSPLRGKAAEETITQMKPLERCIFLVHKLQNKPHFLHQVIKEHKTGKENFHDA